VTFGTPWGSSEERLERPAAAAAAAAVAASAAALNGCGEGFARAALSGGGDSADVSPPPAKEATVRAVAAGLLVHWCSHGPIKPEERRTVR